ncbi:MAG: RICIN domain-containing protein [Oscillospiraceae bacterium]|nr:RICIN domain-containing protein [Oscillospiraceae bacterium]
MRRLFRILQAAFVAAAMTICCIIPQFGVLSLTASAVSADYPMQLINITSKDHGAVLTESGKEDGAAVTMLPLGGGLAGSWRFDYVGTDSIGAFFKICNAESGRLLTPQGYNVNPDADVVMFGSESAKSQHWYVIPTDKDRLGNNLTYKIVNYENTSLALTQGQRSMTLTNYSGAVNQTYLLDSDGLQGFAGYCSNDNTGSIKAANIGGLFGEVVEASSFDELKKYAIAEVPYTIIVTKNISVTNLNKNGDRYMCGAGRIYVHSNKTIIGSYGAHTLFNVQFCTTSGAGVGNNIIIKNFDMQHDAESNHNDSIVCYFGSGQNIWVDHVTFTGHNNYGKAPQTGQVDEDKFLACCYDADYCTVSDCSFGGHKYGLILGYPDDNAGNLSKYGGYPRMSLISNRFNDTNTRGPGLMRWGYFHSLNNYVNKFSMAYTVISDCHIFAENCTYENGGNVICDWDSVPIVGQYSESGSAFSNCKRTKQGGDSNSTAKGCSWRPDTNYSYVSLSAGDAKNYCMSYTGCQNSADNYKYLRFSGKGIPSAGYTEAPSGPAGPVPASFADGSVFRICNANSGLYMQPENGKIENGVNIYQQGINGTLLSEIWILQDAGDGYYYIASAADDKYVLDVAGKKADNGTNIDLYQNNGGINQQFMFLSNGDGTYLICTRISECRSAVEVADADTSSFGNIQEWELNGEACQSWKLEPTVLPLHGKLVQSLSVQDSEHSDAWSIAYDAEAGDKIFGDRDFTFTELPEQLKGAERIVTACDSKTYMDDNAVFMVSADATAYLALDQRVDVPAWIKDDNWKKTGLTAATSREEIVFDIYERTCMPGWRVRLGSNGGQTNAVEYAVFVKKKDARGDVNNDGVLDKADIYLMHEMLFGVYSKAIYAAGRADMNGDGVYNAVDFSIAKGILLAKENA